MPTAIEEAVDRVIAKSLRGDGPLTESLAGLSQKIKNGITARNDFKKSQDPNAVVLTPEQIDAQTRTQLADTAQKTLRPALINAANGQTSGNGLEEVANITGAIGTTASAFGGGILGFITSVPSLISNSFIGDFFKAAVSLFSGGKDKPKSFGEAMARIRFDRGVESFAKEVGADPVELKKALLGTDDAPIVPPAPAPAAASPLAALAPAAEVHPETTVPGQPQGQDIPATTSAQLPSPPAVSAPPSSPDGRTTGH
jgi:hypothetical protein